MAFTSTGKSDRSKISRSGYWSVVVQRDQVYATTRLVTSDVHVFALGDSDRWSKIQSFSLTEGCCFPTLSVTNDYIRCSGGRAGDDVAVYALTGDLVQAQSTSQRSVSSDMNDKQFICSDDDDGNVLLADWTTNRLRIVGTDGQLTDVQLQPQLLQPRGAVILNNQLYVTSADTNTIYRYT